LSQEGYGPLARDALRDWGVKSADFFHS
jgi:hypothetical protein